MWDLAQRLARDGPLPALDVAEVGVKLAGALAAAHARGVLHRDIKPENVLASAYGEPQLSDFGVARIQGGTETRSGGFTGSLAHAGPEASDVYSLASTLYAVVAVAVAGGVLARGDGPPGTEAMMSNGAGASPIAPDPPALAPTTSTVAPAGLTIPVPTPRRPERPQRRCPATPRLRRATRPHGHGRNRRRRVVRQRRASERAWFPLVPDARAVVSSARHARPTH